MNTRAYRALLRPEQGGGFVVSFPDVPEALTSGETKAEALDEARDCLVAALGGYIEVRRPVPKAAARRGEPVYLPSLVVAKLGLYEAMQREGLTAVALGERLGLSEGAVRRLLDLDHCSHLNNVERALAALGQRLLLDVKDRYTYRVKWSAEDGEYVGLCAEFPSLSWLAATPEAALKGIRKVVAEEKDAEDLRAIEEFERKLAAGEEERIPAEMVHLAARRRGPSRDLGRRREGGASATVASSGRARPRKGGRPRGGG